MKSYGKECRYRVGWNIRATKTMSVAHGVSITFPCNSDWLVQKGGWCVDGLGIAIDYSAVIKALTLILLLFSK